MTVSATVSREFIPFHGGCISLFEWSVLSSDLGWPWIFFKRVPPDWFLGDAARWTGAQRLSDISAIKKHVRIAQSVSGSLLSLGRGSTSEGDFEKKSVQKNQKDKVISWLKQSTTNIHAKNPRQKSTTKNPRQKITTKIHDTNPRQKSTTKVHDKNPRQTSTTKIHDKNPRQKSTTKIHDKSPRHVRRQELKIGRKIGRFFGPIFWIFFG